MPSKNTILIYAEKPVPPERALYLILHELGHVFNCTQAKIGICEEGKGWGETRQALLLDPLTQEFAKASGWQIYLSKTAARAVYVPPTKTPTSHAEIDITEDFAESFALYFYNPEWLKKHFLPRYEFIKETILAIGVKQDTQEEKPVLPQEDTKEYLGVFKKSGYNRSFVYCLF